MLNPRLRNITVIIVILVLAVIILIIGRRSPFGTRNSEFHVDNTEKVSRIVINGEKQSVDLQRTDRGWTVNGKHYARPSAIETVLRVIGQMRIKSPVSSAIFQRVRGDDPAPLIEVQIFAARRQIQSFRIYQDNASSHGGIIQKRKDSKPFYVHVPGYDPDPCSHFVVDEKYWMPYTVFNISPEEIGRIDLRYFSREDSSFSIVIRDRDILFSNAVYEGAELDTAAIGRYFSYFTYVPFERWVHGNLSSAGRLFTGIRPYFRLDVFNDDADTLSLMTWTMMKKQGGSATEDTDRLLGSTNGGDDMFIIKYYDLDPLIKGPSYFISD